MKTLTFKCTLLTDVVLNQKAATEGNQESLDFIPGSNFLGIAAGELYYDEEHPRPTHLDLEKCLEIFHAGKVRFGDAHPEQNNQRSLRVPASMYYPKLKNQEGFYVHHTANSDDSDFKSFQPKQCRTGFYVFENNRGLEVNVEKSFAIKSAYDSNKRRSEDGKMYGYQSLLPNSTWLFDVVFEDETLIEPVQKALEGRKRIGRSRTAQYGLVQIELVNNTPIIEQSNQKRDYVLVYADARLIFLDDYGIPTFQPKAEDLGFTGGKINWEKSQIRTFQYAPWNFKRQARDTDRCGIEKGSVFYVEKNSESLNFSHNNNVFVGSYLSEGFGKIIINPAFLDADEKGMSVYKLQKEDKKSVEKNAGISHPNVLFQFLKAKEKEQEALNEIYKFVNEFVNDHEAKFTKAAFASQWGTIRQIAMQNKTKAALERELFTKQENRNGKTVDTAYLKHGVAKDKWNEHKRLEEFEKFFKEKLTEKNAQLVLINLAAEMAKICSNNNKEEKKNGK